MTWLEILPESLSVNNLSLEECRNFKNLHKFLTQEIRGPLGFQIFHKFLQFLLMYGIFCIEEKQFPALNRCWQSLEPLFLGSKFDSDWFVFCWMFCDFPLDKKSGEVLLDHFTKDCLEKPNSQTNHHGHLKEFHRIMKSSRLGLYQEILSTSKVTKYKELFTNKVISTVRSCPEYESGEIFVTRIVSYLGDSFSMHDAKAYPPEFKKQVEDMVENKLFMISSTGNLVNDYERFMKLAGPYWMSCTIQDPAAPILDPDEYLRYY